MLFIERNRLIKNISDLTVFTTAHDKKLTIEQQDDSGATVRLDLKGLVNRRTVEARTYRIHLQKVEHGYIAAKTERIL